VEFIDLRTVLCVVVFRYRINIVICFMCTLHTESIL